MPVIENFYVINYTRAVYNNLYKKGEDSVLAAITNEQAKQICIMLKNGIPSRKISQELGISYNVITNVKLHASYTEVADKLLPEITYKKEDIIRRRFENGESPEYIAESMGIKLSSVLVLLGLQ